MPGASKDTALMGAGDPSLLGLGSCKCGLGRWKGNLGRWKCGLGRWKCGLGSCKCGLGRWKCGLGRWKCGLGRWKCSLGRWIPSISQGHHYFIDNPHSSFPLNLTLMSGKKSAVDMSQRPIKYICTFSNTIADVMSNRGWEEVSSDSEDWDIVWADREWIFSKLYLFILWILTPN